jgi:cell division protein FtsW
MKNNKIIYLDPFLSISFALLIFVGLLILASASMPIAEKNYGTPFYFFYNQIICLSVGVVIIFTFLFIPTKFWEVIAEPLLYTTLFLLLLILFAGTSVNGARRWLSIPGFSLQVSEIFKFSFVLYLAYFIKNHSKQIKNDIKILLVPVLWLCLASFLLLMEPDFGATVVVILTFTCCIFVAGVPLRPLIILVLIAAVALGLLAVFTPYRFARLTTFLHPWDNAYGSGYQLTQALISYGRGDWFGLGFGGSIQKLFFLPEAHTDFIFAILAEELGLTGALFILMLYLAIITRVLQYAILAQENSLNWHAFLCYGFAFYFMTQVFISIGVNLGLLPTKGLTLPLLSYGRSSLLMNCAFIGLILRSILEIKNQVTIAEYGRILWR